MSVTYSAMNDSAHRVGNSGRLPSLTKKEFYNPDDYENTKTILLHKNIRELEPENEKITYLQEQTQMMDVALEDMKRNREEAKKQLEARFQDVYRKINNTKEFVISEGKRINGTILAFQSKFENKMDDMNNNLQNQHDNLNNRCETKFTSIDDECMRLQSEIDLERKERLKQNEDNFNMIRDEINNVQTDLNNERADRIDKDKKLDSRIEDVNFELSEALNKEVQDRTLSNKELHDDLGYEIKLVRQFAEDFKKKGTDEMNHITNNLMKEMNHRLSHQDDILDNLSNVVKTIQDTLKVLGKDV